MRTGEEHAQYKRQQRKWLGDNNVQDGDLYVIVTVPLTDDWPISRLGDRPLKAGEFVRISSEKYNHDETGVTIRRVGGRIHYGLPFWCLSKLESP